MLACYNQLKCIYVKYMCLSTGAYPPLRLRIIFPEIQQIFSGGKQLIKR